MASWELFQGRGRIGPTVRNLDCFASLVSQITLPSVLDMNPQGFVRTNVQTDKPAPQRSFREAQGACQCRVS